MQSHLNEFKITAMSRVLGVSRSGFYRWRQRGGQPANWEADLVCASRGKAALLGCNERRSRFLLLARVEDKTAASFNAALIPSLRAVPPKLRQTLTLDNGPKMAGFRALESATGLRTYFFGRILRGSVAQTKAARGFCGGIFPGAAVFTGSRKR